MPLLTFVARVTDGMLLVASMEYNPMMHSESQEILDVYKAQAKQIFKKLNPRSTSKCTLESGAYTFHYVIEEDICYLTLCDKGYPRRLAFLYLEEIHKDFVDFLTEAEEKKASEEHRSAQDWHRLVDTVARPYAFIKFDKTIKKKGKEYANPNSRSNATRLNEDLAEVQSIMKKNINEVLKRGEGLDAIADINGQLLNESKRFKNEARKVNLMAQWQQYAPFVAVGVILLIVLFLKFYF